MPARSRASRASPGAPAGLEDPAARRERIVEAAADLFYDIGYEATTLDAVAERLGVTKPVIYGQFGSKQELLNEIASRGVVAVLDSIRAVAALEAGPTRRLTVIAQRLVTSALAHHRSVGIVIREEKHLLPPDRERLARLRGAIDRELRTALEDGVAAGEFHVRDVPIAVLAILGVVRCSYLWYRPNGRLTEPELAAEIGALVLAMVGAPGSAGRGQAPRRRRSAGEGPAERIAAPARAVRKRTADPASLGRTKKPGA